MANTQTLSFPIRLPDALQAPAFRLIDASRLAINTMITQLWPQLDCFASERTGPAYDHYELAAARHATAASVLINRLTTGLGCRLGRERKPWC